MTDTKWWGNGIRFQCQGSGKCCTSHGEFGFVYMTLEDRQRMAKHLNLTTAQFTKKYCKKTDGIFHLVDEPGNPDCVFLKNKQCGVYEGRPTQCRTWPFWPEIMSPKKWKAAVVDFCPGINKGPLRTADEIDHQLATQKKSEDNYRKP